MGTDGLYYNRVFMSNSIGSSEKLVNILHQNSHILTQDYLPQAPTINNYNEYEEYHRYSLDKNAGNTVNP